MASRASSDQDTCGICGQLFRDHDSGSDAHVDEGRVEYVITRVRGALADYEAVVDRSDRDTTSLKVLEVNLKLSADDLVGKHFTCRVVRDAYGTTYSEFRLA